MEDLISLTSAFLTATGLFFAALGATATYNEPLKVFLSTCAIVMSGIWYLAASEIADVSNDTGRIGFLLGVLLPALFVFGWGISLSVHGYRWYKGIKGPKM